MAAVGEPVSSQSPVEALSIQLLLYSVHSSYDTCSKILLAPTTAHAASRCKAGGRARLSAWLGNEWAQKRAICDSPSIASQNDVPPF